MSPNDLAGTPQTSLFHDAYLAIENKIVTLEFVPGAVLTEKAIVNAVGYGRTPVREALQRLNLMGLIEIRPRSGIKIADIRPEDYAHVIEPRLALEPLLAQSAARFGGPRDRERIGQAMKDMLASAKNHDVLGFLNQDKALDEAIAAACANPFLPRALEPLQIHSRRFWYQYHGTSGLRESAQAHARVCKAIISGDAETAGVAARALVQHLLTESMAL